MAIRYGATIMIPGEMAEDIRAMKRASDYAQEMIYASFTGTPVAFERQIDFTGCHVWARPGAPLDRTLDMVEQRIPDERHWDARLEDVIGEWIDDMSYWPRPDPHSF